MKKPDLYRNKHIYYNCDLLMIPPTSSQSIILDSVKGEERQGLVPILKEICEV